MLCGRFGSELATEWHIIPDLQNFGYAGFYGLCVRLIGRFFAGMMNSLVLADLWWCERWIGRGCLPVCTCMACPHRIGPTLRLITESGLG
jgi:hypothetical protein